LDEVDNMVIEHFQTRGVSTHLLTAMRRELESLRAPSVWSSLMVKLAGSGPWDSSSEGSHRLGSAASTIRVEDASFFPGAGVRPATRRWQPHESHILESESGTDFTSGTVPDSREFVNSVWGLPDSAESSHSSPELIEEEQPGRDVWSCVPLALSGHGDSALRLWDLERREVVRVLYGHSGWVRCIVADWDRRCAVSGSHDTTLRYWDLEQGLCTHKFQGHVDRVVGIGVDWELELGYSCCGEPTLKCWDLGPKACQLERPPREAMASHPLFASIVSDELAVWELSKGWDRPPVIVSHGAPVLCLAGDVTQNVVVTGSQDCVVRVWDLRSMECTCELTGHLGPVICVDVDTGRPWAISGSEDHTLRFWCFAQKVCLRVLRGHDAPVTSVCADWANQVALSGGLDSCLRYWDLQCGGCIWSFRSYRHTFECLVAKWPQVGGSGPLKPNVSRQCLL